jgi:hypothetical protein
LSSPRRPMTAPETDEGTIRAKYSASVSGRVMRCLLWHELW